MSITPSTTTWQTWMPRGPSERAMDWAIDRRPALAAANAVNSAPPRVAEVAPVKMMVPLPCSTICLAAAWPTTNPARQPSRQTFSSMAGSMSRKGCRCWAPALKTATSRRPSRATSSNTACIWSSKRRSAVLTTASPPSAAISAAIRCSFSSLRATRTARCPARANLRATALPRPSPTPATSASGRWLMSPPAQTAGPDAARPSTAPPRRPPASPAGTRASHGIGRPAHRAGNTVLRAAGADACCGTCRP